MSWTRNKPEILDVSGAKNVCGNDTGRIDFFCLFENTVALPEIKNIPDKDDVIYEVDEEGDTLLSPFFHLR